MGVPDAGGVGAGSESEQAGAHDPQAGAGGEAGAESLLLEPTDFANRRFWFEATDSKWDGPKVSAGDVSDSDLGKWLDSSEYGNDASAASSGRPALISDVINGHPALRFGPSLTALAIVDNASIQFGAKPFAIIGVARWRNSETPIEFDTFGRYGFLLVKVQRAYPFPGLAFYANYPQLFAGRPAMTRLAVQLEQGTAFAISGETGLNDNQFRLFTVWRRTPNELQIRLNGVVDAYTPVGSTLDVSAAGDPLTLGGTEENPFDGDIAEVGAIAGSISEVEMAALERFLLKKYGLPLP